VWYSVAVSTVFQAYITTFLIETGYVEPIKTVEQMVNYEKGFGFMEFALRMFSDSSIFLNSAILKNAVICPDENICFKWAAE
jgi:hypothetical protein